MKIALVVPCGQANMNAMGNVARPTLGVCYLKAYLAKKGYSKVKIFHQINESDEKLIGDILSFEPSIVGFSVMSCVFSAGISLAKMLKNRNASIVTVFGGEHISGICADETRYGLMTDTLKENPCIDFLIPFEGELALAGLVKGIEEAVDLHSIAGIVFRDSQGVYVTSKIERIKNLDFLPMADRSDLPYSKYHSPDEAGDLEYMHSTRGCKFRCSYCATPVSSPGHIAMHSAENIFKELSFLYEKNGRTSFFFCDELFTVEQKRMDMLCNLIIGSNMHGKINWRVFARVDDISGGKLNLANMREAGLKGLFFGVESMNPRTLNLLGKRTNPQQIKNAIMQTHEANIDVWCSLMVGYPWETEIELEKSLGEYLAMKSMIKHTYVAFITPFLGTPFYRECIDNNWIENPKFLELNCNEPVLKTPIKKEKLIAIYQAFLEKV